MFRRSKTAEPAATSAQDKLGGKGRPTPTRKEAQAAAKAMAKGPTDRKEAARLQRQRRTESSAKIREGMKAGDERYRPARDKGPVRRFVRDWIDSRLCIAEMLLPLLDTSWVVFRLRRELRRRFPDTSTKGAVGYGVLRSLQLRWIRLPKPKVKLGAKLPQRY